MGGMFFNFSDLEWRFAEALGLIVLACLFVPLTKKLGLGRIVGYLAAGVTAGLAFKLSYAEHPEELLHFAEFGVVLFLFVIGLELRPDHLWAMRKMIFGRGLVQVLLCGFLMTIPPLLFGLTWQVSLVIGLGLALSSTALVMQGLDEKGERGSPTGRTALSILLFEDLAIVPLLLLVQILSAGGEMGTLGENLTSVGLGLLAIGTLIVVGHYGLDRMFRLLAYARTPEITTAGALGVVIAASLLMDMAGLSYAMGAFIAGVMLADSSYRHELEADIEPFRGILLGLFFVAIGLSLDLGSVAANWLVVLLATPLFLGLKIAGVYAAGRWFKADHASSMKVAGVLSQHGEFGFVIFAAASSSLLLDGQTSSMLVVIITLSMAISPFAEKLLIRLADEKTVSGDQPPVEVHGGKALIIGFGRVGQIASQALLAEHIPVTLIDNDPKRIQQAAKFDFQVHFGEGTRRDVLQAAGAAEAKLIIICVDDVKRIDTIFALVKRNFPQAKVLVRAYDRIHAIRLHALDADFVVRETLEAGLALGGQALAELGYASTERDGIINKLRQRDAEHLLNQVHENRGNPDYQVTLEKITPHPLTKTTGSDKEKHITKLL